MKVWYQSILNFAQAPNYKTTLQRVFDQVKDPSTEVAIRGRGNAGRGLSNSDVIGSPATYLKIVSPVVLNAVLQAEREGFDAFVVGSFSEPIVPELRSLASIPVVTMPEAAMLLACTVAPRFALISISRIAAEPYLAKTIKAHGLADRVTGIHVVEDSATEEQVYAHFSDPQPYLQMFADTCRAAIAAGADAIVPAEGMLAAMVADAAMHEIDGAPIVSSVGASILFAEMAVRLHRISGWQQSRRAYPRPSAEAMRVLFGK